ncbi:MAG: hypothetical protein SFU98_02805 [Leptospiraceae bacterium]|nr:hypothetical protein [Leptospiraceae bacterium]
MVKILKKSFVFFILFLSSSIMAVEVEIGTLGGLTNIFSNDSGIRRSIDKYNFYNTKFPDGSDRALNAYYGLRGKVTSNTGKFAFNTNLNSYASQSYTYERTDTLLYLSLALATSGSTGLLSLLEGISKSNVKVNYNRIDYFGDGVFYIVPKFIGLGLGYRTINVGTNSSVAGLIRGSFISDKNSYNSSGPQLSLYLELPKIEDNIEFNFRVSYFRLGGLYNQSYQDVGQGLIQVSDNSFQAFNYLTRANLVGNPFVRRVGAELDFTAYINIIPSVPAFRIFVGSTYQESRVSVNDYASLSLTALTIPQSRLATEASISSSYLYSKLVEAPIYQQERIDRLISFYFGASYKFGGETQKSPEKKAEENTGENL